MSKLWSLSKKSEFKDQYGDCHIYFIDGAKFLYLYVDHYNRWVVKSDLSELEDSYYGFTDIVGKVSILRTVDAKKKAIDIIRQYLNTKKEAIDTILDKLGV